MFHFSKNLIKKLYLLINSCQYFQNQLQSVAVPLTTRHFEVVNGEVPHFVHHRQHVALVAKEADVVGVVMDTGHPDELPVAHVGLEAHPDARLAVRGAVCRVKITLFCQGEIKAQGFLFLFFYLF